jgi:hypothetical protein
MLISVNVSDFPGTPRMSIGRDLPTALVLLMAALLAAPSWGQQIPTSVWLKADFGAVGDGTSEDTAAVHAFLAACKTAALCQMEPGSYRVTTAPKKMNYAIRLQGAGFGASEFIRDYDEVSGRGFLHFEGVPAGKGPVLGNFSISSAANHSGGHALVAMSTPDETFGNMLVEHVKFSTYGVNSWDSTVLLDGTQKTTGARGLRAVNFDNCLIFGAAGYSLVLRGAIDFRYEGGIYAAGGTSSHSGGILVTGTIDVPSSGILFTGNAFGYFNLSHVIGMKVIAASGIAGRVLDGVQVAIDNDSTVDLVQIIAEPFGTVGHNWTRSSVVLPDGQILRYSVTTFRQEAAVFTRAMALLGFSVVAAILLMRNRVPAARAEAKLRADIAELQVHETLGDVVEQIGDVRQVLQAPPGGRVLEVSQRDRRSNL